MLQKKKQQTPKIQRTESKESKCNRFLASWS